MATITFAVATVNVCTTRHTEIQQLSEVDLARWALKDEKWSLENFQINYPLAAELKGSVSNGNLKHSVRVHFAKPKILFSECIS